MQHSPKLEVTPDMIERYNRPGPRYTSYPTVPVWEVGEFDDDYTASLQKEGRNNKPISLYVHIPFCQQLCTFCGCNKYITKLFPMNGFNNNSKTLVNKGFFIKSHTKNSWYFFTNQ